MNLELSQRALIALGQAPVEVQRAFIKQANHLVRDLHYPGLHAKKYNEATGEWQGRVNADWRFWFEIRKGVYHVLDIRPHPK